MNCDVCKLYIYNISFASVSINAFNVHDVAALFFVGFRVLFQQLLLSRMACLEQAFILMKWRICHWQERRGEL